MTSYNLTNYSNKAGWAEMSSGSRKLLTPTPTRRNRCCGPRATRSLSESAIAVSSSHDEGGEEGVWLRTVPGLTSLVLPIESPLRALH